MNFILSDNATSQNLPAIFPVMKTYLHKHTYHACDIMHNINNGDAKNSVSTNKTIESSLAHVTLPFAREKVASFLAYRLWFICTQRRSFVAQLGSGTTIHQIFVNSLHSEVSSLHSCVNSLQSEVSSLQSWVNSLQSEINSLQSEVNSLQSEVNSLQSEVSSLQSEVSSLHSWVRQLASLNMPLPCSENEHTWYFVTSAIPVQWSHACMSLKSISQYFYSNNL